LALVVISPSRLLACVPTFEGVLVLIALGADEGLRLLELKLMPKRLKAEAGAVGMSAKPSIRLIILTTVSRLIIS
jgi:hypothetical protein